MGTLVIRVDASDNVGVVPCAIDAGAEIRWEAGSLRTVERIEFDHKVALRRIGKDDPVVKYGEPIGRATRDIRRGESVHRHNCESLRDGATADGPGSARWMQRSKVHEASMERDAGEPGRLTFMGFRRADGRAGVRNHVLVLPTVQCANAVAERIGRAVPDVVALPHIYGCSQVGPDLEQTTRVLEGFAGHPNVGATLLVSLGCESLDARALLERLSARGQRAELITIQEVGGSRAAAEAGAEIVRSMLDDVAKDVREPMPLSELTVAVECGGSDAWSGITANPAAGAAADRVVEGGGTIILSEVTEMIGAEGVLTSRSANRSVADSLLRFIVERESSWRELGVDLRGAQPTPGDIAGGITTIEEKSLGAIAKGGRSPVVEAVEYGCAPTKRGLVIMNTAGNDAESVTGMVGGGAQLVIFTTGRGSPTGCPIAPVLKVASNAPMFARLREDMDLCASDVVDGEPIDSVGDRIFRRLIEAAEGTRTASELAGHREFAIEIVSRRV